MKDPELNLDLMVLGLVYEIEVIDTHVKARISLTSPFCPVAGAILDEAKQAIEGRANEIRKQIADTTSSYDREKLQERLGRPL